MDALLPPLLLQIAVFVSPPLSPAHQPSASRSSARGPQQQSGPFCPSIFHCRVTFFHYLPDAFSFHGADLGRGEGGREGGSRRRCRAVGKVRFAGRFVDKWGKIDPRQMGGDNGRPGEKD